MHMAAQNLFIEPVLHFEKVAAEVTLPDDPNQWSSEIMQELYKQVPYLHDFQVSVRMERVDGEKGFGFGSAEVTSKTEAPMDTPQEQMDAAGIRTARIPIIIRDGKLQPFDVLINDQAKMLPLTESRLRQAMFRPHQFDVTSKTPGDTSMIGQLYPPYRQNYGFAGGGSVVSSGMGKTSSAESKTKHAFLGWLGGSRSKDILLAKTEAEAVRLAQQNPDKDVVLAKEGSADLELESDGSSDLEKWLAKEAGVKGEAVKRVSEFISKHPKKLIGGAAGAGVAAGGAGGVVAGKKIEHESDPTRPGSRAQRRTQSEIQAKSRGGVAPVIGHEGRVRGYASSNRPGVFDRALATRGARQFYGTTARLGDVLPYKTSSVLHAALLLGNESDFDEFKQALTDDDTRYSFAKNAAAQDALLLFEGYEPPSLSKVASALPQYIKPTVLQVRKLDDGYGIKTASRHVWCPIEEIVDRGQVVARCGEKIALAADTTGAVTVADGEGVGEEEAPPQEDSGLIEQAGTYAVETVEGEPLQGTVIPNLIDVDGSPVPISLFTDGERSAVQGDIAGVLVSDQAEVQGLPAAQAQGSGVFYSEVGGVPTATVPMELGPSYQEGEEPGAYQATTFDGRQVQVSVQPQLQNVVSVDDKMLIPDSWQWLPLGDTENVGLVSGPEDVGKQAQAYQKLACVEVRASDPNCFSFSGLAVDKLAAAEREELTQDEAMFLLGGLGANLDSAQVKLAKASTGFRPEYIRIGNMLKTAKELRGESYVKAEDYLSRQPVFRHRLWKEAAVIPDPVAVDTVLSLGFINPENVAAFVSYLPVLEESQEKLCELLMGSRLGIKEIPVGALERSIRALEEVISGLKVMAFQE
jgi:hypothetical protein